jgi:hypothetical protein
MRAEPRRRKSSWVAGGIALAAMSALSLGCTSVEDVAGKGSSFVESQLDDEAHALQLERSDALFAEPRTIEKVTASMEFAVRSMTSRDNYAATWRVLRACAWLGQNHPDRERRLAYGQRGISIGLEALESENVASAPTHYYLAVTMGAFCEVKGTCDAAFVREMRDQAQMAFDADPRIDHCGPGRFLGKLIVETLDYPGYSIGSLEEALRLLRAVRDECPDFVENELFLAEALIEDADDEEAERRLQSVIASKAPADHTVEHAAWVERAKELLDDL